MPEAFALLGNTGKIDSQFKSIAATLRLNFVSAVGELAPGNRPAVSPKQGADAKHAATSEVEIGLKVARHDFNPLVDDGASEMSRTCLAVTGCNHHAPATMQHITANIVKVGTCHVLGTPHYDVISGVHTVTAGAMGTEQIIIAVMINQVCGLTVDSNIKFLVAFYPFGRLGIQFYQPDVSEVSAVGSPESSRRGIQQQARIDGITVFHTIGGCHFDRFRKLKVGRLGV